MRLKISISIILPAFLCFLFSTDAHARSRKLHIEGLRIFSAAELSRSIKVTGESTSKSTGETVRAIDTFYKEAGYAIVKVHVVRDTADELSLFIDEGKLARIVVHEQNNYYALKYKQAIVIPGRIYNTSAVKKSIENLVRRYGFAGVRADLEKTPDYDENVFQLNRELNSIELFDLKIQVFSKYPAEYELHFYFDYGEGRNGPGFKRDGWSFDIDYNYPSVIIPVITLYNSGLLYDGDSLETDFSAGFDPGLEGMFSLHPHNTLEIPPRRTFSMIETEYRFAPFRRTIFTPVTRGRVYHSASGRPDLGYTSFRYVSLRGTLAPGITPLENLNIYAGLGCEADRYYEVEEDPLLGGYDGVKEEWKYYPFTEIRLTFDPLPSRPGMRTERNFTVTFTHYFDGIEFSELDVEGSRDFEFSNLSILSFRLRGIYNNRAAPFNHHASVNSQFFKGFNGLSYYSNRLFAFSTEYRFSVYEDYVYTGVFCDWAVWRPEGLILTGVKNGFVAGPTARFLIYDQFELTVYAGWDRLLPDGSTQKNIKFRLARRW